MSHPAPSEKQESTSEQLPMQFIEDVYGPEGKVIFPFPMLRRLALVASPEPTDAHDEWEQHEVRGAGSPHRAPCPLEGLASPCGMDHNADLGQNQGG